MNQKLATIPSHLEPTRPIAYLLCAAEILLLAEPSRRNQALYLMFDLAIKSFVECLISVVPHYEVRPGFS